MSCWFLLLELCGSTYSRTGIRGSLATGSGYSPGVASVRLLLMAFWLGRLAEADILALRSKIVAGSLRLSTGHAVRSSSNFIWASGEVGGFTSRGG